MSNFNSSPLPVRAAMERSGQISSLNSGFRTAESVSPKHPDKLCDQISDAILDAHLAEDQDARVAVDVVGGHGKVFVTGEVTSRAKNIDINKIVRRIAGQNVEVIEHLSQQSSEIAQGVDTGGAGDQGIMIGYATDETPELLPLEYALARSLNQFIYDKYPYDGKTQITSKEGQISAIVASFQNALDTDLLKLIWKWVEKNQLVGDMTAFANPAGNWSQGGFDADAGLTGRKLAVDNYGPRIALGGGCFSGKDPSKVDRSAAYMARRVAVDYLRVAKESCKIHENCAKSFGAELNSSSDPWSKSENDKNGHEVFVRLAYAIGVAEPLERSVIIDGRHDVIDAKYDLTSRGIIEKLDLLKPQYERTAAWGHFGRGFVWDK